MYEIILNPDASERNDNNDTVNPAVLYDTKDNNRYFAFIHVDIYIGEEQYIPSPADGDIVAVNNTTKNTPNGDKYGEDITFKLKVRGPEGGKLRNVKGTLTYEIMKQEVPGANTIDSVQEMMGGREYNMTVELYRENVKKNNKSGTINNQSNIEIE